MTRSVYHKSAAARGHVWGGRPRPPGIIQSAVLRSLPLMSPSQGAGCYPRVQRFMISFMLDDVKRAEIAKLLDDLAAQEVWNKDIWQRCYDSVSANMNENDLLSYVHDDLIHYTGRRLFRSSPLAKDFNPYRQEFRDVATALRSGMSLSEYKKQYE